MAIQSKNVVCDSVSTIVPAHPAPTTNYFLSNFDLLSASPPEYKNVYIQCVYYFRTKKDDPITPSIQSLKDSFSEVLSVYPVFAGRLKIGDEGRLEVLVNGEGVPFIEATTEASLDDWPDLHLCDIVQDLYPKDVLVTNVFTAPLLAVQFTNFQCGAIALGFSSSHIIADGQATMEFFKAWGEIHRGARISNPPQFESIRLVHARTPPTVNFPSADEVFSACKPVHHDYSSDQSSIPVAGKSIPHCRSVVFQIERHMIDKCIQDVETGAFSYGSASSFEALSALLWAAVTRARGLEDGAMTTYSFVVNLRGRLQPPLPQGFFGNAVIIAQVTANAKDIESSHLSFAASLIHRQVQKVQPEFIHSAIDWMELRLQQKREIGVGFDTTTGRDLTNTSWANFPVYDVDFGWGKPDHFGFPMLDTFPGDGMLCILPAPPSAGKGSIEVKVRLSEDHLQRLLNDHYFQLYFQHIKVEHV